MKRAKLLLFVLLVVTASGLFAQNCKPAIRANRGKRIQILNNEAKSFSWTDPTDLSSITMEMHTGRKDSATLKRNGNPFPALRTDGVNILSERYVESDSEGRLRRIDSLMPGQPANATYFGLLYAHTRVARFYHENGIPSKTIWKSVNGADSVTEMWNAGGIMLSRITGSRETEWTEEGIIREDRQTKWPNQVRSFNTEGILKSVRIDTMVKETYRVTCLRDYYPSGILRSTRYFYYETPCLTWLEYDEKGVLRKETPHSPLDILPPEAVLEMAPEIYWVVDERGGYSLGKDAWINELHTLLTGLLCTSREPLSGNYSISYQATGDRVELIATEGLNADALEQSLRQFMAEHAGKWYPLKHNGIQIDEVQTVTFSVAPVKTKKHSSR